MKRRLTLKQARKRQGISQSEFAQNLGIAAPKLCLYEGGSINPTLDEMIEMEEKFDTPIKWQEPLTEYDKVLLLNSLGILMDQYPAKTVIEFAKKQFEKKDIDSVQQIKNYADFSSREEILLPPNVKDNDN